MLGGAAGATKLSAKLALLDLDLADDNAAGAVVPDRYYRIDLDFEHNEGVAHGAVLRFLGVPVVRPRVTETTALGAAYLAGLATGLWSGAAEITAQWQVQRRFEPRLPQAARRAKLARWRQAVERSKAWADN